MTRKRLLILNGSHSEIPLIRAGKSLGYEVITTGNAPELIGHRFADRYISADYSDPDAITEVALQVGADRICSCANDFGIITAAEVCERLDFPGHDSANTTRLLHTKDTFKNFARKHKLDTPEAWPLQSLDEALSIIDRLHFPVIVKPVDLTGGKGVAKVTEISRYRHCVEQAFQLSRKKCIVVEKYIEGKQHSLSTFLVNGKVVFHYSDNEFSHFNPYYVNASSSPAHQINTHLPGLLNNIERIAKALHLVDGVFHVQYLAQSNMAVIIDITRRCSGDMYSAPVSRATGIDWAEWIVKAEAGHNCHDFPEARQTGYHGRYCVMGERTGEVAGVTIDPELHPYLIDKLYWWQQGCRIDDPMNQKVGILFLQYPSEKVMDDITRRLPNLVRIQYARKSS